MASLLIRLLALALSVTALFTYSSGHGHTYDPYNDKARMIYHGGPMLNGTIKLAIMWYGNCGKEIKNTMRNFIKSLSVPGKAKLQPQVTCWWKVVESYQSMIPDTKPGKSPKIRVKVVKQSGEKTYKYGKVLTLQGHIPELIEHVTKGDTELFPVIVAARDVSIQGICNGKCADHLLTEDPHPRPYIIVGNPETECPGECGWPFFPADMGPKGPVLKPPSGNMAADAMVVAFAGALVDAITNPMNDALYHSNKAKKLGPATVCKGIFGRGAAPGNPGEVLTDPKTGGSFNAHGNNNKKFLLPAIWNPKTKSCWTV
ncbi:Mitochondrial intermembrane space import and assembly 40 [Gossypium arboreum]|uniref:Mitochondrial intermembrane space import and assembly 40 n=2 Tax=Gossypium arboreum TaxID=29729 RepID=A0A0B0N377_GOSAR|nr:protein EXORDIUM-like 6 [Gossypium arboreum]KAK5843217.1 hypothetical protein PVK06_005666 [Gossypium arboreum]KHG08858.1 Mitochondrial intermembrane space import and assembly 40 [Gossypium arboreum]